MTPVEGFEPPRIVTQDDRVWCTKFDNSDGFLEGKWDDGLVTMPKVLNHRIAVESALARRIFDEVHADADISTDAATKVYAAIKRALTSVPPARAALSQENCP